MIPYYLLLLIPLLMQYIYGSLYTYGNISNTTTVKHKSILIPAFFCFFILLLSIRNKTVGRDLVNYESMFNSFGQTSFNDLFFQVKDVGFRLHCWLFYNVISTNYQLFLAITAILSVLPVAYVYSQDKSYGYTKIIIFVNMSTFVMFFSGIRQGLAIGIGVLAYWALKNDRIIIFFFWAAIAFLIHHTGFMILFMFPLYYVKFKKRDLGWIIPSVIIILVFNKPIFNYLGSILGEIDEKYDTSASSTGAFASFVLFVLFALFCYFVSDESKMDKEAFALRNYLSIMVVLQSFASVHMLAMRMNYYYIILAPLAIGKSINNVKPNFIQVAKIGKIIICSFFTVYYIYTVYKSYVTGVSALDTVPYIPFWKG